MNNVASNLMRFQGNLQVLEQFHTSPHQVRAVAAQPQRLTIRAVYLSDLHQIQQIYLADSSKENFSDRTEKFGLPLVLACIGKEVIGYASMVFNANHQSEIHLFFKQEFESEEMRAQLYDCVQAEPSFILGRGLKLENSITRFTNWLNTTI